MGDDLDWRAHGIRRRGVGRKQSWSTPGSENGCVSTAPLAAGRRATGDGPTLWRGPKGGHAQLVSGTPPPDVVELWDWTQLPGEAHDTEAHSTGTRELLLVLDGSLDVRVAGHTQRLAAGDSAAFAGDVPHGYAAPADAISPTRFALSMFEPDVGGGRR